VIPLLQEATYRLGTQILTEPSWPFLSYRARHWINLPPPNSKHSFSL